jgi:hypothetical protein
LGARVRARVSRAHDSELYGRASPEIAEHVEV